MRVLLKSTTLNTTQNITVFLKSGHRAELHHTVNTYSFSDLARSSQGFFDNQGKKLVMCFDQTYSNTKLLMNVSKKDECDVAM
jgi:hypothetical protein